MKILITGGAGFIGSNLVKYFVKKYPRYKIFNLDKLNFPESKFFLNEMSNYKNYCFLRGDILDSSFLMKIFDNYKFSHVINLAAETHVDNSISNPVKFIENNILGTTKLIEQFRRTNINNLDKSLFYQISTDEVFGSTDEGSFDESSKYCPNSPYSASKASADLIIYSYFKTFGIPYKISFCCNNFGPNQQYEKLIPKIIYNAVNNISIPIYGDGSNMREWLYVEDHVSAIDSIFHSGDTNSTYNIGSGFEISNIDLANKICDLIDTKNGVNKFKKRSLIKFVDDRPGHDFRYFLNSNKLISNLSWTIKNSFEHNLSNTIDWYLSKIK